MATNGRHSTSVDLSWVAKRQKNCFALHANLTSTKVSASHSKSTQVHARPGRTDFQVDPSFQLASTCDSVWPGPLLKIAIQRVLNMEEDIFVIRE